MNKSSKHIAHAFNLAAATYNHHANIQRITGETLIRMITSINTHFHTVIDAGCGTGLVTEKLIRRISYTSFIACDISAASLDIASSLPSDIKLVECDYNEIKLMTPPVNLIFANMSLHWSQSLADTLSILNATLASKGILAFSIPMMGTFNEIQKHYSCRDYLTHYSVTKLLADAGLTLLHSAQTTHTNHYNDTLSALRAIKHTGVSYVPNRNHKTLLGKNYLQQHPVHQLTYVTGYYLAMKHDE